MTYYSIYSLQISTMAFFTAFVCCVIIGKSIFSLAIHEYAPNTSKINTRLFRLAVFLNALNAIYRATSLLILGSLTTIIW